MKQLPDHLSNALSLFKSISQNLIRATLYISIAWGILFASSGQSDQAERKDLIEAALSVAPSVVRIDRVAAQGAGGDMLEGTPTSGLVIDAAGWVVTSRLSIAGEPSGLLVTTIDGKRFGAKLIAEDISREIALLQIDSPEGLVAANLSEKLDVPQGLGVIAVGCAVESTSPTISLGIISGSQRAWGRALQSDARVSLAQYGGPLLDRQGQVLGIVIPATGTEMAGDAGLDWYDSGVTLATPSHAIRQRMAKLRSGKSIHAGLMGVSWGDLFVLGTTITSVHPGSPAAKAGIKPNDEILAIGEKAVTRMDQVRVAMGAYDATDRIAIKLRNDKGSRTVELELVESLPPFEPGILGIWCETRNEILTITQTLPSSPATTAKLAAGDVIAKAVGDSLSRPIELSNQVNMIGKGGSIELSLGDDRNVSVIPTPITGKLPDSLPAFELVDETWTWQDFALPELPNKAKLWGPPTGSERTYGLLTIAALPSRKKLEEVAIAWQTEAQRDGVLLLVLGSRDAEHWNADEAETLGRLARQAMRRYKIDSLRSGVSGEGPGAALALVAGLSKPETFRGVACPSDTKLPRIRPTQNDPAQSLQLLWMGGEELPKWMTALKKFGYGIRFCNDVKIDALEGGKQLLLWNRLLGLI